MSQFIEHPPARSDPLETLAQLRGALNQVMTLEGHTVLEQGGYEFYGSLTTGSEQAFDHIYESFTELEFTPRLFQREGQEVVHAVRGVVRPGPTNPRTNVILLLLTILTTLFAGSLYGASDALESELRRNPDILGILFNNPLFLLDGLPYTLTLLGILGVHEMGHYVAGRIHKADVTLPYFIPMPFGLGTMGAVILLRSPIRNRRQLFDIGVAGPLAGLAIAIPLLIVGLATSPVEPVPVPLVPGGQEGNSILYFLLKFLVHGQALPGNGVDVFLNSVAFAGWLGLFITALNLLPVGSLDGGHVTYAIFGEIQWRIARVVWYVMLAAGILLFLAFNQILNIWLLWAFLLQMVFGLKHPPPLDDITPLDPKRRSLGIFTMVMFVLLIVPIPFS